MMNPELRAKIIAFNKKRKEEQAEAKVMAEAIKKMPPEQLKEKLSSEEKTVLSKHGIDV
jgi:hypothetical protein